MREEALKAVARLPEVKKPSIGGHAGPVSEKSKILAGILGLLLGGFGIHRFYLGFTAIGIAQIVVTLISLRWGGIGGLWGFTEGILILAGVIKKDANGNILT